jgi:3-oxoacyl-[acyl-carrier-protein] synthase III
MSGISPMDLDLVILATSTPDAAVRDGRVKPGDTIAASGFGAGLTWGAAIFKWG